MSEEADSYKHNYAILVEIANTLRTQQEPDIDALIPMVEKATAAYKVCKSRIEAVKETFLERVLKVPNSIKVVQA